MKPGPATSVFRISSFSGRHSMILFETSRGACRAHASIWRMLPATQGLTVPTGQKSLTRDEVAVAHLGGVSSACGLE
jgi:hypothetical protein